MFYTRDVTHHVRIVMRFRLVSSTISEAVYHPTSLILEVCFHSGHVYRYSGVPKDIVDDFLTASSVGRFYNQHIKGKFPSLRWF